MLRLLTLLLTLLPLLALAATDYYALLSVPKDADTRQLKKAYRKLSKQYHPDKNPDDESAHQRFVELSQAYEVLAVVSTTSTARKA
jgi:DnaJ-related protein SCJ1